MASTKSNISANDKTSRQRYKEKEDLITMKKGYQEMADINLSLAKLCFEVEREVESYYDCVVESE